MDLQPVQLGLTYCHQQFYNILFRNHYDVSATVSLLVEISTRLQKQHNFPTYVNSNKLSQQGFCVAKRTDLSRPDSIPKAKQFLRHFDYFRCWNFTTFMVVSGMGGFFNAGVFTLQTVELGSKQS